MAYWVSYRRHGCLGVLPKTWLTVCATEGMAVWVCYRRHGLLYALPKALLSGCATKTWMSGCTTRTWLTGCATEDMADELTTFFRVQIIVQLVKFGKFGKG